MNKKITQEDIEHLLQRPFNTQEVVVTKHGEKVPARYSSGENFLTIVEVEGLAIEIMDLINSTN